jgi:hypothetical protein
MYWQNWSIRFEAVIGTRYNHAVVSLAAKALSVERENLSAVIKQDDEWVRRSRPTTEFAASA